VPYLENGSVHYLARETVFASDRMGAWMIKDALPHPLPTISKPTPLNFFAMEDGFDTHEVLTFDFWEYLRRERRTGSGCMLLYNSKQTKSDKSTAVSVFKGVRLFKKFSWEGRSGLNWSDGSTRFRFCPGGIDGDPFCNVLYTKSFVESSSIDWKKGDQDKSLTIVGIRPRSEQGKVQKICIQEWTKLEWK
jgi:hypothetical protein